MTSSRVCRAKIKPILQVARSDRILQKASAKSSSCHGKRGRDFSKVFGLRGEVTYLFCSHLQYQMLCDLPHLSSSLNNNDLHYLEGPKGIFNLIFPWDALRVNRTRLNPNPKLWDARASLEAASDCHVVAKCLLIPTYSCFLLAPENYGYPRDDYCTPGNTEFL